jgi:hypothetical protein
LRTVSVAIVVVALLIVLSAPTPAFAPTIAIMAFMDHPPPNAHFMLVDTGTGEFWIYLNYFGFDLQPGYDDHVNAILLCYGVGARITNGGLVLTIQSSYSAFGAASYVRCQAGIYRSVRASGMIAGIVTVMLAGPTSVGYPSILVLSMSQMVGFTEIR